MAKTPSSSLLFLILTISFLLALSTSPSADGKEIQIDWMLEKASTSQCTGTVAECLVSNEFDMGSGTQRRMLGEITFISYGALLANFIPCSLRGSSYYNCEPGASANPYTRPCSTMSGCYRE